ncbi:copper amine oxidase N-terminal domain-containing protein [Paenibacillus sp. 22594]|uniref:copper amine oxidase N-terminal domain-containing protein n=1 Tax=Paenibacillus sp. 22594 TaxID=3453947 RepID=UPI003F82F6AD
MAKKMLLPAAIALLLLSGASPSPVSAQKAATVQVVLTFTNHSTLSSGETGDAQVKNGVTYMPASIITPAGFALKWDNSSKKAVFSGWEKSFTVQVGSRTGVLDGKKLDTGGTPYLFNHQLYVPVKFIVSALEGKTVRWNPQTQQLLADGLHMYRAYSESHAGSVYTVSLDTGELFITTGGSPKRKLASLGSGLDLVHFKFEQTPAGLTMLRISNSYGEPHIYREYFTYLLKNTALIRQAHTGFHSTFSEPAVWSGGKLLLNNGRTLRLIEDGTGDVIETIDLPQLMGISKSNPPAVYYNVEGWYSDVAVIRPGDTGFLTLVNRNTGAQTPLYKVLVDADRQRVLEQVDSMFPGDNIFLTGRTGNTLTFTGYITGGKDEVYTYTLPDGE